MVGRQVLPRRGKGRGLLTTFLVLIATCLSFLCHFLPLPLSVSLSSLPLPTSFPFTDRLHRLQH